MSSRTEGLTSRTLLNDFKGSYRSFKPLLIDSQEIQSRLKSIATSIKELEDEEYLFNGRRTLDGSEAQPKKDYEVRLERVLNTHESMELQLAQAKQDLAALADQRDYQKVLLLEVEEMLGVVRVLPRRASNMPLPLPVSKKTDTAEKASQVDTIGESQSYVESIERRHYNYMLEAFKALRFTADVYSPLEIKHPKRSKHIVESARISHSEEHIRLKGTISELNSSLSSLVLSLPKPAASLAQPFHRKQQRSFIPRSSKASFFPATEGFLLAQPDLEIALHLRLDTLDPFIVTQTNSFPRARNVALSLLYDEIEYYQWKVPEVADVRFNIKDIVPLGLTQDDLHLKKYFRTKQQPELDYAALFQQVYAHVAVLKVVKKYRFKLRGMFLSYNVEGMQTLPQLLTMSFAGFVSMLKDAMLISRDFEVLDAAKVFYLAFVNSKQLPESALSDEKSWLKALVMGSAFKEHYQLRFPNFIESLIRLVALHPRFVRLASVPIYERIHLLYKRDLKPNVRLTQSYFYTPYLADPFVIRSIYIHETELHSLFEDYQTSLSDVEKVTDFVERHGKLELGKFYSLLSNSGVLLDAEVQARTQEDVDKELLSPTPSSHTLLYSPGPPKTSAIRFPSTLLEKADNQNLKIIASRNIRFDASSSLSLPFYRPLRAKFTVDKLTVFNFFVSTMKNNDELFLTDPKLATDQRFVLTFSEFCEVVGLLGLHFWKTTATCRDLSMTEGISYFIKIMVERHRFYRELRGLTSTKIMAESKEILHAYALDSLNSALSLITKTVLAQERFIQRRLSA